MLGTRCDAGTARLQDILRTPDPARAARVQDLLRAETFDVPMSTTPPDGPRRRAERLHYRQREDTSFPVIYFDMNFSCSPSHSSESESSSQAVKVAMRAPPG